MKSIRAELGRIFGVGGNTVEETSETVVTEKKEEVRVTGKIIKVDKTGYGFISSKEVAFTRIFFHWTSLRPDTLNFKDLKNGMTVTFVPIQVPDKGFRAIKIRVETPVVAESQPESVKTE